jgi:hypothetical protein
MCLSKPLLRFAWLLLALMLPALACSGLGTDGSPDAGPRATAPPVAQLAPAEPYPPAMGAVGATTLPESATLDAGQALDDFFSIERVTDSWAALHSYRLEFRLHYAPTTGGSEQWLSAETLYVDRPRATSRTLHFRSGGQGAVSDAASLVQVGNHSFISVAGAGCLSGPGDSALAENPFAELTTPDTFVRGLTGARRQLPDEAIHGVPVRHYTFDQHSLRELPGQVTSLEGHIYVSVQHGYVVRLTLVAYGREMAALGQKEEARLGLEIDVLDVNQPLIVLPPAECGQADAAPYPLLPDAAARMVLPDLFSYRSGYSLAEAVDFYRQEMPAAGWTSVGEELLLEHLAMLHFEKNGIPATVTIGYENGNDLIAVLILRGP